MPESPKRVRAIRMHFDDSVAILIEDAAAGDEIVLETGAGAAEPAVRAAEPIPYGHKVALRAIAVGEPVIKYGERMGIARTAIAPGEHVHVHNVRGLTTEERSVSARG